MRVVSFASLMTLSAALIDHDGWEFYGGHKKRNRHGLNSATKEGAPKNEQGGVSFDKRIESKSEIIVTNDEAPPASKVSVASTDAGARIKAKQELLLLPDRFSVLNFDRPNTENQEVEILSADSSWWGRLYVEGFPSSMQYFRAHFGKPPPEGSFDFLLASPLNMCDDLAGISILNNEADVGEKTVIVATRGECTFGEKAITAYEAGAAGILFVNSQEGNFHPSGPDAGDVQLSASMISKDDGNHLIQALSTAKNEGNPDNTTIKGRFVPIYCNSTNSSSYCAPVAKSDDAFVQSLEYKGKIGWGNVEFDYLQGEFGSHLNQLVKWTTLVPSVIGGDAHCCEEEGFEGNEVSNTHAILCLRGECDFASKAENVASIGAGLMLVASHNDTLYRMGCDPPYRGRKLEVATAMVSMDAYDAMVGDFYTNLDSNSSSIIKVTEIETFSNVC